MFRRIVLVVLFLFSSAVQAADNPMRVVVLGDSLTAGFGLPKGEDFATKLEQALLSDGLNVKVQNAGISGNTSADGLARVPTVVAGLPKPSLVIVALGANDMLRRIGPATMKDNISAILTFLKDRDIPVYLIGMQNPGAFGPFLRGPYGEAFDDLADEYDVKLFPFFLKGVALDKNLNQADGLHPNEKGVAIMVDNIAGDVAELLEGK